MIFDDITKTVGNTPLVRLNRIPKENDCVAEILAKLEFFNPLSSIKDRAALGMIEAVERQGRLAPGGILVEATSGNTGIGMAFVAAARGYTLILTMPENMSVERRMLLSFMGAEIILTSADEGMAGAIAMAEEIVRTHKNALMLRQFSNPANPAIHRETTGPEIWRDTEGRVDAVVAGVGTGGTIQGVAEALKEKRKEIQIIAVEPSRSPVLSGGQPNVHGIQGIGANFVPEILDRSFLDEILGIADEEALTCSRELACKEGILAGPSSGAVLAAALKVARRPVMAGKRIVVIFCDGAERYLSTELFKASA